MTVFELLQDQVSPKEILERYSQVRGSKARCVAPGHEDNNPSMCLYDDDVHCFSCGFHGDVVNVWAAMRDFERPIEAALNLAREFGVELPEMNPQARQRVQARREKEDLYLRQARASHDALEIHAHVRVWWEGRGFGEDLQQRFLLGASEDGTEAMIPFWHRGRVHALIRRKLEGEPKYIYPKAEDFSTAHKPLFIPGQLGAGGFLVEGIVDALALVALGESGIAVCGTNISREQMEELNRLSGPLHILPDNDDDERGQKAARKWVRDLYPKALLYPAEYGEGDKMRKDFAEVFADKGEVARQTLQALQERAVDGLEVAISELPDTPSKRERLKYVRESIFTLVLSLPDDSDRLAALEDVSAATELKVSVLKRALQEDTHRREVEAVAKERAKAKAATSTALGGERRELALALLNSSDLLEQAVEDMNRLGHVGERGTKKLALLCALSAKAGYPIQPSTHAQSSAGKNALWDTVLSLLPEEMIVRRSGLSAKALFRTEANLKGAVLYLQEVAGSEDASYTIRVMQSDGRLEYEATEKMADGSMKNVVYQTEGPTVIVQTTTKNHLHPENETRVFPIYIDESEEQTGRIVASILTEASGNGVSSSLRESILQRWRDGIRLLEPAEVVIPYADRIEIPSSPIRIRRDARRLVDVVRVIAWLHQHQRERDDAGRILAAEEDFHTALSLVSESLSRAWQTLAPAEETVLREIKELPQGLQGRGFKRRDLNVAGVSDRRMKEVLKSLTDTGYLDCDGRQGPQGYTYTVAREAEEISLGISLRPPPDKQESPANNNNSNGQNAFARYRPGPDSTGDGDAYREAGAIGRSGHRPIRHGDLQEKYATGRTGDGNEEEKITQEPEQKALVMNDSWEEV